MEEDFDIPHEDFAIPTTDDAFNAILLAEVWRRGRMVSSLVDLTEDVPAKDQKRGTLSRKVAEFGEGRRTIEEALPAETVARSLSMGFTNRVSSTMRFRFQERAETGEE